MKRLAVLIVHAAVTCIGGVLVACGTRPVHQPAVGLAETSSAGGNLVDGADADAGHVYLSGAGRLGMGDMTGERQAMCELHLRMTVTATPEARQVVIDKHMGAMTPETRNHLMAMMRDQCP